MATQSQGIQQLLAAEKRAAEIVSEARKRRTKRLRQAKDEAVLEVEAFKSQKEKEYKTLEQQSLGSRSSNEGTIKTKTDQMIKEMTLAFDGNSQTVLKDVLAAICSVQPQKHGNLIVV